MNTESIHVVPIGELWAVMTDRREFIKKGLATRKEAVQIAGQEAAGGKYQFLVIHAKDDLVARHAGRHAA